jgi:hypothetical protein
MGYPEDNFKGARGKRFGEGQSREGNGRRPNVLGRLIEVYNISVQDINNIFKNVVFPHTMGELQDMVSGKNAKDLPALEVMIISALLQDTKKGSLMGIMQILDRVMGKPSQSVDITTSGGRLEIVSMTPKERQKHIVDLLEEAAGRVKKAENEAGKTDNLPKRKRTGKTSGASGTGKKRAGLS